MDDPATPATGAALAKRRLADLYSRVAPEYEQMGPPFFAYAGCRLVDLAGVVPGERVLDVGVGRGAVLFPAADIVGAAGRAIGIDIATEMVAQTALAITHRTLPNAEVCQMDVERLAFGEASFDRVRCSYAIFWFPNIAQALAEIRRVLRPGGAVAFAFERGRDERWRWYEDSLRAMGALDGLPHLPGGGAIRHQGALVQALDGAGFVAPRERVEEVELFYPDEEAWWSSLWTHGARLPLERLPPASLERVRTRCLRRARSLVTADGLPERHRFVFVTAQRPADAPAE